jgi:phosphoesterase RecJ-like protein
MEQVMDVIRRHGRFVLTTHVNPDGDGLGSELALMAGLRRLGKSPAIVNHSPTPEHYRWLDPAGFAERYEAGRHDSVIASAEAILVLDTNQPDRLRAMEGPVRASAATRAVIDHHLDPHPFADAYFIDSDATSTGEMIFRLLEAIGGVEIDAEIAVPLYTAIMTDTGSFRYPRTGAGTHRIASRLIECGADPPSIFGKVYETWSPGRMRLLGEALDTLSLSGGGAVASMMTTREMFSRTGTTEIETDTFSTYPMNIRNVRIGILFTELTDGVKISFRSKGTIPVNLLAKEFGGNGHLNASGARLHDVALGDLVPRVLAAAEKYLSQESSSPSNQGTTP